MELFPRSFRGMCIFGSSVPRVYVEDVSLFVSFAFFVVIKYRFYNSLMKSGLICEIIAERVPMFRDCRTPIGMDPKNGPCLL
jgi:hypothetical protein